MGVLSPERHAIAPSLRRRANHSAAEEEISSAVLTITATIRRTDGADHSMIQALRHD